MADEHGANGRSSSKTLYNQAKALATMLLAFNARLSFDIPGSRLRFKSDCCMLEELHPIDARYTRQSPLVLTRFYPYSACRRKGSVVCSDSGISSWAELEKRLPSAKHQEPVVYNSTCSGSNKLNLEGKLVLYRDRNGWCPYAERVWLALEVKRADYVTVLIDDKYDNPRGVPRVQWPDGTIQESSDIYKILERIEAEYPHAPNFYPDVSVSVAIVRNNIERRFDGVLPRYTKPSALAPYVFREEDGKVVPEFKYDVFLEEVEEILEEYDDGPFFAGIFSVADIFWAPFLERFAAHFPLLYKDLRPRSQNFEAIDVWFDAMDEFVPCYSCRVKGRVETWQAVLTKSHPGLKLQDNIEAIPNLPTKSSFDARKVWEDFAKGRPYLAPTPAQEVAARIVRERGSLSKSNSAACRAIGDTEVVDAALREVCDALIASEDSDAATAASNLSSEGQKAASFLHREGLLAPRDVGVIPAEALRALVDGVLERSSGAV